MNFKTSRPLARGVGSRFASRAPLAVILLTAVLTGCGEKRDAAPNASLSKSPIVQVQTQIAQKKPELNTEEVVGTIRAKLHATLEAKLSGRIDKMPVLLGQSVKACQLVARLDAAEVKARLDQAQAAFDQAERDWKRISSLFEAQAVTRSEYDAADARQRMAKAAVAEAVALLAYAEVSAPFDGVVTKKWAEVGDLATPGKPLLELEDPAALQLEADVAEAIAPLIKPGARLGLRVESLSGELFGSVAEIAPAADPSTRTFRVKLDLPPAQGLKSGQFARLLVPTGEIASLRVPGSAVVQRGQLEIVFVVANQRAELHLVKTGKSIGNELEILAGLDAGDAVVTEGAALLTDGQPVEAK
jgi:RND family efflux transporter MFP subunit